MKYYVKDYPRPQFVRDNWENLNGAWDFRFDDDNAGERDKWYEEFEKQHEIQVPFIVNDITNFCFRLLQEP